MEIFYFGSPTYVRNFIFWRLLSAGITLPWNSSYFFPWFSMYIRSLLMRVGNFGALSTMVRSLLEEKLTGQVFLLFSFLSGSFSWPFSILVILIELFFLDLHWSKTLYFKMVGILPMERSCLRGGWASERNLLGRDWVWLGMGLKAFYFFGRKKG